MTTDFTNYKCSQCNWSIPSRLLTNDEAHELVIDHIYNHTPADHFHIDREKAKKLKEYFYANGYVSYEFYSEIIDMIRDLDRFLEEEK